MGCIEGGARSVGAAGPVIVAGCVLAVALLAGAARAQETPSSLRVAILTQDMPGADPGLASSLHEALVEAAFSVAMLPAAQLADPDIFSRARYDALIIPHSPHFPGQARENLTRFLQAGGHLVLLGGHAFSAPLCRIQDQWRDRAAFEKLLAERPVTTSLFSFEGGDLSAWQRSTNKPEHQSRAVAAPGQVGQCMRLELKSLGQGQWDIFGATVPCSPSASDDLLCLWVRGGDRTPQVVVEVDETDGSRWIAVVPLTPHWRRVVLEADAFRFFRDGSPAGRGEAGDRLRLERARRVAFGLATGLSTHPDGDHIIEIDELGTAVNDLGARAADYEPPNTVCFDDYEPYVLRDVVRATVCEKQDLVPPMDPVEGRLQGLSAVGFTLWDRAELVPLLRAEDRYGRNRGWVLSALIHYGGAYRGGCWLLSGVTSPDFLRSEGLRQAVVAFLRAVAIRDLPREAAARNELRKSTTLPLTSPAPEPLRWASGARHFLRPDGRRFFMLGCNYIGSLDRKFMGGPWLAWLEEDFRAAQEAGLNCMRVYGTTSLYADPAKVAALKECARRYGIYLLMTVVDHTTLLSREELVAHARRVAGFFADEPMLLGYDLQNEPYAYRLAQIRDGDTSLGERYPLWQRWGEYERWADLQTTGNFTSFPGVNGPLPRDEQWGPVLDATSGIFSDWIRWQVEAIRGVDATHAITVGYNCVFACLPANSQLDFVSHHAYQPPADFQGVMRNLTTLDRLRKVWPDKPISLGEFGYTNGMKLGGEYLDLYTSALGECLHYLYAFAHDYEGCLKWVLTDHPLELSRQQCTWIAPDDLATHIDQGRYGLYWSDGTCVPRPKPVVWATRFFREYLDADGRPGELTVTPANTRIGTGYVFRAPGALFVGNVTHDGPGLQFSASHAANVLLRWEPERLMLVSTADATVRLNPGAFTAALAGRRLAIRGTLGQARRSGDWWELELLEGERVELTAAP